MDTTLFLALYQAAHQWAWLDGLIVFLASYLQYLLVAGLIVSWFWPVLHRTVRRRAVLIGLGAAIIARLVVKSVLVLLIHRARPYAALTAIEPIVRVSPGEVFESFPSGHAIFFFALAVVLERHDRRWGIWYGVAALVMGLARIAGGVHWPGDVVGGALVGLGIGWACWRIGGMLKWHA